MISLRQRLLGHGLPLSPYWHRCWREGSHHQAAGASGDTESLRSVALGHEAQR